jgi:hypothetical protein
VTVSPEWLRQVVRDAVRELLDEPRPTAPEVREVAIGSDAELAAFVATLLDQTRSPQGRAALESGALRYRLAPAGRPRSGARLVEKGAVTEAVVTAAATAGERIVVRAGVVVTPLARDAARRLAVPIDREA